MSEEKEMIAFNDMHDVFTALVIISGALAITALFAACFLKGKTARTVINICMGVALILLGEELASLIGNTKMPGEELVIGSLTVSFLVAVLLRFARKKPGGKGSHSRKKRPNKSKMLPGA